MAKEFLENWNGVPVYLDLIPYGTSYWTKIRYWKSNLRSIS